MTKPTVYLETSVISYLTARPSRDLITAARQQITRDWWEKRRNNFELVSSDAVLDEVLKGDPIAAERREEILDGMPLVAYEERAGQLAKELLSGVPLPGSAAVDALHIALAAVHCARYLLTWNCTHLANAELRPRIEAVCRRTGVQPPIICTPEELMDTPDDSRAN